MPTYTCRRCEYTQDTKWEGACPGCGGFYRWKQKGVDSDEADLDAYSTMGSGRSKGKHVYLSTGQESFDRVLGGGLVAGRVVLFGGFAGAGKTRVLLLASDYIAKTQGVVIFASSEESREDVNGTAASLGLVNDRVIILGNQRSVEKVLALAEKVKAFLVIYDSAQKFASEYCAGTVGSGAQLKAVGEAIKLHCGKTKTCAIVVNQMSSAGDLRGGTELEHHCDTIMILAYPKDDDDTAPLVKDVRLLEGGKNRCGPENIKAYFKMSDEGRPESIPARSRLILGADEDDDDDDDDEGEEEEKPRSKYAAKFARG